VAIARVRLDHRVDAVVQAFQGCRLAVDFLPCGRVRRVQGLDDSSAADVVLALDHPASPREQAARAAACPGLAAWMSCALCRPPAYRSPRDEQYRGTAKRLAQLALAVAPYAIPESRDTLDGDTTFSYASRAPSARQCGAGGPVNAEGCRVEGERQPSSETDVHLVVYRRRPGVNAIVHTEPVYSNVLGVRRGHGEGPEDPQRSHLGQPRLDDRRHIAAKGRNDLRQLRAKEPPGT
jgi:Class II Aldolase and Adducin N-terminal domain